jgi:hypothetical protein
LIQNANEARFLAGISEEAEKGHAAEESSLNSSKQVA